MSKNRGVVYTKPAEVQVQDIADPKFEDPRGRKIEHGVILKVVSTNICGSDQHMVRGRTTAPAGMVLGHEITGEVNEKGRDVEYLEIGDLGSVPDRSRGRHRSLPSRQLRPCRGRLRICRYGRMDRWAGRLRHGALCRLQSAEISGQSSGDGQDPGSDLP